MIKYKAVILLNQFMKLAIEEARIAMCGGEVPVGAVVTKNGVVVAKAHNLVEKLHDSTAHAEILAIRKAGEALGNWRLTECSLYVTLEPCAMCAAALLRARIAALYFGSFDSEFGAVESNSLIVNPRLSVYCGIEEDECNKIIRSFFDKKRLKCE